MMIGAMKSTGVMASAGLLWVVGCVGVANAQGAPAAAPAPATAVTSCLVAPARMSDADVSAFLAAPDQFVKSGANPLDVSNQVRSLTGSSSSTLDPIMAIAKGADPATAASIGAGLGRAARACAAVDPLYAALIQTRVAELGVESLTVAFTSATNETTTAALGSVGADASAGAISVTPTDTASQGNAGANLGGDEFVADNGAQPTIAANTARYFAPAPSSASQADGSPVTP